MNFEKNINKYVLKNTIVKFCTFYIKFSEIAFKFLFTIILLLFFETKKKLIHFEKVIHVFEISYFYKTKKYITN